MVADVLSGKYELIFYKKYQILTLKQDELQILTERRTKAEQNVQCSPYDPQHWLHLSDIYFDLCFSELHVSCGYNALVLSNSALMMENNKFGRKIRGIVSRRLSVQSMIIVVTSLSACRLNAYRSILRGLSDCGAYWNGLMEARKALLLYPKDEHLLHLQNSLKKDFEEKARLLQGISVASNVSKQLTRWGRMDKRQYPWLELTLFIRTPAMLRKFNLLLNSQTCEIRPVSFGGEPRTMKEGEDVGPLGLFARFGIRKDTALLIDDNVSMISDIPSEKYQNCDACHASLSKLHIDANRICYARCCDKVAFCSNGCREQAENGYHGVLCGKDFSWICSVPQKDEAIKEENWRLLILLRIFAIIIADLSRAEREGHRGLHPLSHPLLARLTAGYASDLILPMEEQWSYRVNVTGPNKILRQLGIDVFKSSAWSAEVIHTIVWRVMNNACSAYSVTAEKDGPVTRCSLRGICPNYVFFNHSCESSVNWTSIGIFDGCIGYDVVGTPLYERDVRGRGVGNSAMLCLTKRDVKKDEEVRISYVPQGNKEQLAKWFEGDCKCESCNGEKEQERRNGQRKDEKKEATAEIVDLLA